MEREDDVDEEEQLDAALQQDKEGKTTLWRARAWVTSFQERLGVVWVDESVGSNLIHIVTSCTDPSPTVALQDLRLPGCSHLVTATEVGGVSMKLIRCLISVEPPLLQQPAKKKSLELECQNQAAHARDATHSTT